MDGTVNRGTRVECRVGQPIAAVAEPAGFPVRRGAAIQAVRRACKEPFCGQQGTPGRQRRPQCGPQPSGSQPGPVRPLTASCWIRRSLAVSSRYGRPLRGSPLGLGALFRGAIVSMLYRSASRCTYPTGMQRGRPRMRGGPCVNQMSAKSPPIAHKGSQKIRPGTAPGPAGRCPGAGRCR